MRDRFLLTALALAAIAACANHTTDAAPASSAGTNGANDPLPGSSVPGSPAEVWSTTGGPASPGVPSGGRVLSRDAGAQ